MPVMPRNTKCAQLGCKNDRSKLSQYCIDHGGRDTHRPEKSEDRQEFNSMYSDSAWRKLRQTQLSRQPLCQGCMMDKRIESASEVDHVFSWSHIGKQAFFNNKFQSLCKSCHTLKTGLERKGIYRYYHDGVMTDYTLSDYKTICMG